MFPRVPGVPLLGGKDAADDFGHHQLAVALK
jgi:hypothetical protein